MLNHLEDQEIDGNGCLEIRGCEDIKWLEWTQIRVRWQVLVLSNFCYANELMGNNIKMNIEENIL
jgi:hypothetical protein